MQMTTLMLELNDEQVHGLLVLCQSEIRGQFAHLCESQEKAAAINQALDEIAWQLASSGHEGALEILSSVHTR